MPPKKKEEAVVEGLFPALPEDLSELTDEELATLLEDHNSAAKMIDEEDAEFIGDLNAEQILEELALGAEQKQKIEDEIASRVAAREEYQNQKDELMSKFKQPEEEPVAELAGESEGGDDGGEGGDEGGDGEPEPEGEGEPEGEAAAEAEEATVEPVTAAANGRTRVMRRPPAAARERMVEEKPKGTPLIAAAGGPGIRNPGAPMTRMDLAAAMVEAVKRLGTPTKHEKGVEERYLLARADYPFPEDRILRPGEPSQNSAKIAAIGSPFVGGDAGLQPLVASGGLCAPLTPFYDIPDFAVRDRPVRGALPSFQAVRGGVSVPSVSTIGDITTAITVIEEDEDALGGTFATKSCQDFTCPTWTDVPVGIISHCREYGNLNAMAWPEGISHENNLTMAAHARTAETRLLDRIKTLSINVTSASVYNAAFDLIYAATRAAAGIRYRLRLGENAPVLRALMPVWVLDLLVADSAASQVDDRFKARAEVERILRGAGVVPAFYLDSPSTGTFQGFAAETASALDDFPDDVQWALYVEGEFLHLDGGVLELGIVRDSTLNQTNDYQVFGETFENVARIGPTQGALWVTSTVCPDGTFPALQTALAC
jgi:hypothetical protein